MARIDFTPERGIIIDLDLNPIKGSETGKIRPCIVVTNDTYNRILSVIQVVPITDWTQKKASVKTNITIDKTAKNGLTKKSIADCLQNRPVDYQKRFIKFRGYLDLATIEEIDVALRIIFNL